MLRPLHLARRLGVLVLPLALAGGALPAAAAGFLQTAQADAPQAGSQGAAYSQEQLESYAAAVMKVQEIDRAWQPKIQQAEDQQQADQMATEATDEMIGQIEAQGLSVEEYNAITQAAAQDQQLYDRIVALLPPAQQSRGVDARPRRPRPAGGPGR